LNDRKKSRKSAFWPSATGHLPEIMLKSVAEWVEHHPRLVQSGFFLLAVINTYFSYIVWPQSHLLGLANGAIAVILFAAVIVAT
jgi:hypothetical protein